MKRTLLPRLAVLGGLAFSLPVFAQYSSPMRDVDNGARQPVNFSFTITVLSGNPQGADSTSVTIPAGKRLVIETISYSAAVNAGEQGNLLIKVTAGAGTSTGATSAFHLLPSLKQLSSSSQDLIGGIGAFRMYADAGSQVLVYYNRVTTADALSVSVSITGHYVNLP